MLYGSEESVEIAVEVEVFRCEECEGQFTGPSAEDARAENER